MIRPLGCAGAPWRRAREGCFRVAGNGPSAARAGREMPCGPGLQGRELVDSRRAGTRCDRQNRTERAGWAAHGRRGMVRRFRRRAARAWSGRRARADTYGPAARLPARPVARAGASLRAPHPARGRARRRTGARLRRQPSFGPTRSRLAGATAKAPLPCRRPAFRTAHRLPGAQSQELARGRTCPSQAGLPFRARAVHCRHYAPDCAVIRGGPTRPSSPLPPIVLRTGTHALCKLGRSALEAPCTSRPECIQSLPLIMKGLRARAWRPDAPRTGEPGCGASRAPPCDPRLPAGTCGG